jgi:predicted Rossmann fold flavoprotein
MNSRSSDVIIVGAGAAGLMCAIEAAKRGRSVIVLERNDTIGKKIGISGGGRCNFTNLNVTPEHFVSQNPNFHKSALSRYTPDDFIAMVERHGITYHEKKLGQLFCDDSAQQIIAMLLDEKPGEIVLNCRVDSVEKRARFELRTNLGEFDCASLVIATGGLSIPRMGATDFGYRVAQQFGLSRVEPRPGLVPFLLSGPETARFQDLHGVSLDAVVRFGRVSFRENLLFTHRGLSGPAILQISTYWRPGKAISIDVLPGDETPPRRFLKAWNAAYAPGKPRSQWSRKETEEFDNRSHDWLVTPSGTEGYEKAEVTSGGVDTRELSSQTLESNKIPGLYFIGEVVDVTGHLGGFNFQWAWASGYVAGQVV